MYFVDRGKIEELLVFLQQKISLFEEMEAWNSPIEKAALERITQLFIEIILDTGNAMIDGFIMRDPGSYDDIIDILEDEKVINQEMSNSFKEMIQYRKMLVQTYTEIEHEEILSVFRHHLPLVKEYPAKVRAYIINELGPVSAFKN